jgi:hypothetical protein
MLPWNLKKQILDPDHKYEWCKSRHQQRMQVRTASGQGATWAQEQTRKADLNDLFWKNALEDHAHYADLFRKRPLKVSEHSLRKRLLQMETPRSILFGRQIFPATRKNFSSAPVKTDFQY